MLWERVCVHISCVVTLYSFMKQKGGTELGCRGGAGTGPYSLLVAIPPANHVHPLPKCCSYTATLASLAGNRLCWIYW